MRSANAQSTYRAGNAWFVCDRCSQRRRRSVMQTEWTGLKVCPVCLDPRPPQMEPPEIYPEGIPFPDARAPQDNGDDMMDDTTLRPVTGGVTPDMGGQPNLPNGQVSPVGAVSPMTVVETPLPDRAPGQVLDDVAIRTGPVFAPGGSGD